MTEAAESELEEFAARLEAKARAVLGAVVLDALSAAKLAGLAVQAMEADLSRPGTTAPRPATAILAISIRAFSYSLQEFNRALLKEPIDVADLGKLVAKILALACGCMSARHALGFAWSPETERACRVAVVAIDGVVEHVAIDNQRSN